MDPSGRPPATVDISVVISTCNRDDSLPAILEAVLHQEHDGFAYEVVVVDNKSIDNTVQILESWTRSCPSLRYAIEPRRGPSHGRNRGIALARAPIIAITDDDVVVTPDWLRCIKRALDEHPQVDFVGGKVLPRWIAPPPAWLTREHWSPLALLDFGDRPFDVNSANRLCLITANFAIRRCTIEAMGGFAGEFLRCQDHELQLRLWAAGREGRYVPDAVVFANVQSERVERGYHRMWHARNGTFHALMPPNQLFAAPAGHVGEQFMYLFGVPSFTYRQLLGAARRWLGCLLRGRVGEAFVHETRVCYLLGYMRKRFELSGNGLSLSRFAELCAFGKAIHRKKPWLFGRTAVDAQPGAPPRVEGEP
jgi:glucosyl-dolichyl phosphate glucuronosyltransferase